MSDRISERNRIKARARDIESFIKFNSNAIGRLRQGSANPEFCRNKIEQLKLDNQNLSAELKELDERSQRLACGDLDSELKKQRKNETAIADKKKREKRQQKLNEIAEKEKRSVISKEYWNNTLKAGREARYAERSSKRGYNYVLRVQQSLPQYIRANLANMPNNKGYIWRGIHYYGLKDPEQGSNFVMFENKKGALLIHEWSTDYLTYVLTQKKNKNDKRGEIELIKRFKRNGSGRRVLISEEKPKPGTVNPLKQFTRNTKRTSRTSRRKTKDARKQKKLTPAEARRRSRGGKMVNQKQKPINKHRRSGFAASRSSGANQRAGGRGVNGKAQSRVEKQRNGGGGRGKSRTLPAWMTKDLK